jgi:ubiquinone/menaquinone biosynthesis C-methylase UbiE
MFLKYEYYKNKSKNGFNRQARTYDHDKNGRHARSMYKYIIEKIKNISFKTVLDIGCGTGEILSLITKHNSVRAFGMDISLEMLTVAEDKLGGRANLIIADAGNLPYDECFFDLVICNDSFHHYPNPIGVLSEIKRVLKNKGTLILSDICLPPLKRKLLNMFIFLSPDGDFKIYSEKDITKLINEAGFNSCTYEKVTNNGFILCAKK